MKKKIFEFEWVGREFHVNKYFVVVKHVLNMRP